MMSFIKIMCTQNSNNLINSGGEENDKCFNTLLEKDVIVADLQNWFSLLYD